MRKNRYQIEQMLNGVREELLQASNKLNDMYMDSKTSIADREAQEDRVKDLEQRESGLKNQLDALDREAAERMKANKGPQDRILDEKTKIINAKAELIKNTMAGKPVPQEVLNILGDGSSLGNGQKILPTTLTTQLVTEPFAKNPLRNLSTFTNIMNLEIPRISFTLDDDDFLDSDSATAKELKTSTDTIQFGRKKFKVYADVTETVLRGTATNLVETVETALRSGMAKKEKTYALATDAAAVEESSFYHKTSDAYDITAVEGATMFDAITNALADLEDDYADNAKILMKKSDYIAMIKTLSNSSVALYGKQPEEVLGAPVEFCSLATVPVVGDFSYSHFNYDLDVTYESDKNIKTGVTSFVLTGYMDHKIKLKSAFRLAVVKN